MLIYLKYLNLKALPPIAELFIIFVVNEIIDQMHPLACAHLATSIAGWLPLLGRHNAQQEALVPHFFWQSWRAGTHLGSFWQAAHWLGHFCSMHCWGSSKVRAVVVS